MNQYFDPELIALYDKTVLNEDYSSFANNLFLTMLFDEGRIKILYDAFMWAAWDHISEADITFCEMIDTLQDDFVGSDDHEWILSAATITLIRYFLLFLVAGDTTDRDRSDEETNCKNHFRDELLFFMRNIGFPYDDYQQWNQWRDYLFEDLSEYTRPEVIEKFLSK